MDLLKKSVIVIIEESNKKNQNRYSKYNYNERILYDDVIYMINTILIMEDK